GEFINSKSNRNKLAELYGDELAEFGQTALDERLAQLADKNSSVENLTVDDRKLLSGVLKAKLEDAGTKVNGHFLKRLNEGDADTFSKALGSIGSVKQTALPEELSTEIARLRDEIKTLSDSAIQASNKAESAEFNKQIKARHAKINSIQTLGKDIAKLETELQAASDNFVKANATGKTDAIVKASDKVLTLQTKLDKQRAELAKIMSPQVQDATPQQAPPANQQTADFMANANAQIHRLKSQLTPDLSREQTAKLTQQIQEQTATLDKVTKLNAQIDALTTKAAEAYKNLQNPETQAVAIQQLSDATKQLQAAEAKLAKIITPQVQDATPEPSKQFAPVKAQADEAVANLDARIAELQAQDETANEAEIENLTDKLYAIQAAANELAKTDAQFQPLKQARVDANKAKDATAYNAAQKKLEQLNARYKKQKAALDKLLTPQETPQAQENSAPVNETVANELASIQQQRSELVGQGLRENAAEISKLNDRRDKIQRGNNEIANLNAQTAELESQLAQTTESQAQETLKDKIAKLQATIDGKTTALSNFINPPATKSDKKQAETYPPSADIQAKVDEVNARIRELRNSGEKQNSAEIANLSRQRDTIQTTSNEVGRLNAQRAQAEQNGDAQQVDSLTGKIANLNTKLNNAVQKLGKILNPPAPKSDKKQSETYPVSPEFQSELDGIKSRMNELRADDEEKNSAEIAKLAKRSAEIRKANDNIAKWTAARLEKERQRAEAERNGDNQLSTKLTGEIATLNGNIRTTRSKLINNLASTDDAQESSPTVTATRFMQEALAPPANGNDKAAQKSRREQGKKLIVLAAQNDIQLDDDTKKSLERGKKSTIIETQRRLLDSGKLFNRPQQQETQPTANTNVIEDLTLAHEEISSDKNERKAQGAAIVRVANFTQRVNSPQFQQQFGKARVPKIDLPDGMERDLQNGDENAIRKAQEIFDDAELVIRDSAETETAPETQGDGLRGNTAEVITASRTAHQIRYRVVEADELTASHKLTNNGVVDNKNYPAELQPRDRNRADMQAQATRMANNLKPADLMEARDVNQGAPVTRNDGIVLNGNGRVMAIQRAYEIGRGDAYKNALIENAEQFGLNANEISQMNQPVLVRELTHSLSGKELQDLTKSQTGGASFGASEQAKVDADAISLAAFNALPKTGNVDLTSAAATDFLRAVLQDIANANEINALTDKDGKISADGIRRVKRALFALAYGDDEFIARMSESNDDNIKGVTNAFDDAAPIVAQVQLAMKRGDLHSYDLNDLITAAKKLSALRDEGKTVKTYLNEQGLFAEHADTNEMREVLSFFDANKYSTNKITAFLKKIAQEIQSQGNPRQDNLFSAKKPKPLIELIRKAREDVETGRQADLFAAQTESKTQAETQLPAKSEKQATPETKRQETTPKIEQQDDEDFTTDDGSIFGSIEAAERDMLESLKELGIEPLDKKAQEKESAVAEKDTRRPKLVNFVDDSDESLDAAWKELDELLRKPHANAVFNPKIWKVALKIGAIYVQRGINTFADWAKTMTGATKSGEQLKPWLPAIWETINALPEGSKFSENQILNISKYIGSLIEKGQATTFEDVQTRFEQNFGKDATAKISPMIEASFKGIQKFFADQRQASKQTQSPETKKAAVTITGNEFGEYDGIDDLRKKAVLYYSEHLQGTSVENETLGKIDIDENGLINFTGSGKRELKNSSAKINKLLLVKHLPELIQNSTDITGKSSTKERHKGDYFYYLHTSAQIDDKTIPVEITVVKRNNGEIQYYNHTLPSEEKTKDAVVSTEPESSNEALGTLSIPASSVEVETSNENIPQAEQSDKDERIFETGEFNNPETGQQQAGIRFNEILPQEEYARLKEIAAEYNGIYHEHGNMILFRDESDRDAFVDDATGNYRGSEITKPISQARTVTQLKQIFRTVYKLDLGAVEGLSMSIRSLKEFVGALVDSFADAGKIKFVNGEIQYSDAKSREEIKNAFANMVQRKAVDATSKEPLPTIDSLKKKIRETLADWNDAKITVSPQWDDAEERVATDAKDFSIIPTRTLAGDIFKISYGNFGLAAYDTQRQALDALGELNAAVKRGDKKFVFPTEEQSEQTSPVKHEDTTVSEPSANEIEESSETAEQAETVEPESTELTNQGEIVYPDGTLTFGERGSAVDEYLDLSNGKTINESDAFRKQTGKTVKINGREMTRLEAVEEIAKGNLDQSTLNPTKSERDYLKWLQKNLMEPLKAIQQAGIQNERAAKRYVGRYATPETIYFENVDKDAATLEQLTKLAETFGGTAQKNQSGNTLFKFQTGADTAAFHRAAHLFTNNAHTAYFNPDAVQKTEPEVGKREQKAVDEAVNEPISVKTNTTETNPQQVQSTNQGEIVYPNGALVYGDKSAVEAFKTDGYRDRALMPSEKAKFDENNKRTVTIDGREMTRLEVVEGIAKGNLDESAMKLNKREREYLDWLRKRLIEPLKKIQQAGIQTERADKIYNGYVDNQTNTVYFVDREENEANDATTLEQLTKLAEAFGGTAQKNQSGNTRFNFATYKDARAFQETAKFFMNNRHLAYFNPDAIEKPDPKIEALKQVAADKNQSADLRAQAALELNSIDKSKLIDGVKVTAVPMAQNKQGVWRVKLAGTFPIIRTTKDNGEIEKTNTLWETNGLFDDLSNSLGGRFYADETWHFKDKRDAEAFKAALDIFFGFKKAPKTSKSVIRTVAEDDDTGGWGAVINDDAVKQIVTGNAALESFKSQVATVGKKVTDMVKAGTLTQAEAEEIAGKLMDRFNELGRHLKSGLITQDEAEEGLHKAVERVNERLEQAPAKVSDKNTEVAETPTEEKALDLFTLFDVEKPENPTEEFNNTYREIQNAWDAFLDGENDILETADKINEIVGEFSTTTSSERYLHERKILNTLRDKIKAIKPSPELQKQFDEGWEIFFTLKRTFDKMHDEGKVNDDEYKKKRKTIDDFEQKIQDEKITSVKAAVKLHDLLPEVTTEEIQDYLSTRNEKREATLLRMTKDWREAINVFYDGSLIDTDAVDRGIESGDWDKLMAQLPEKTIETLLAEARRTKRELKKSANNGERYTSKTEKSDKPAEKLPADEQSAETNKSIDDKQNESTSNADTALEEKRQSDEKTLPTINPFDVEISQIAATQSEDFQKAYSEMNDLWNDYLNGKLDINTVVTEAERIFNRYNKSIAPLRDNYSAFDDPLQKILRNISEIQRSAERNNAEKIEREPAPVEESTAQKQSKATEQKTNDPIEQRAREALKAAGLEGKTAPEGYSIKIRYNEGANYLVIVEHTDTEKSITRGISKDLGVLAYQFNGETFGDNNDSLSWYDFGTQKADATAFQRAVNIYFGNEEVDDNAEESGTGERSVDGHRDVEPAVRQRTDEETRTQERVENVGDDSGQERQTQSGINEDTARTNAEDTRPVQADDAGSTGARTG
ncbi:MAG: hypothetical protein IJ774_15415, partial [Selenomonadaceae bacterium]|nr:hypothetical protein [Selenomonadaceae bacterium]